MRHVLMSTVRRKADELPASCHGVADLTFP